MLVRFKKLFSTDKIIEKTQKKVNFLTNEIDTSGNRSLFLINKATEELKKTISEAENEISKYNEATQRLREMISLVEKKTADITSQNSLIYSELPVKTVTKDDSKKGSYAKINAIKSYSKKIENLPESIDPEAVYEIIGAEQGDLFEENTFENTPKSILKDETTVLPDGAAYKEVPLIITKVLDETPVSNDTKKDEAQSIYMNNQGTGITNTIGASNAKAKFTNNVISLYDEGFSVEQIAEQLSCSVTEIQMIIDLEIE